MCYASFQNNFGRFACTDMEKSLRSIAKFKKQSEEQYLQFVWKKPPQNIIAYLNM